MTDDQLPLDLGESQALALAVSQAYHHKHGALWVVTATAGSLQPHHWDSIGAQLLDHWYEVRGFDVGKEHQRRLRSGLDWGLYPDRRAIGSEWVRTEKDPYGYVGTFTKRLRRWIHRQELPMPPDTWFARLGEQLGRDLGARIWGCQLSREIDWDAGEFGDDRSCYWTTNAPARKALAGRPDFWALKIFKRQANNTWRGAARCWLLALRPGSLTYAYGVKRTAFEHETEQAWAMLNAYGYPLLDCAKMLSIALGWKMREGRLEQLGDCAHIYLNNGGLTYFLGPPEVMGQAPLAASLHGQLHIDAPRPPCLACGSKECRPCHTCGACGCECGCCPSCKRHRADCMCHKPAPGVGCGLPREGYCNHYPHPLNHPHCRCCWECNQPTCVCPRCPLCGLKVELCGRRYHTYERASDGRRVKRYACPLGNPTKRAAYERWGADAQQHTAWASIAQGLLDKLEVLAGRRVDWDTTNGRCGAWVLGQRRCNARVTKIWQKAQENERQ